MASSDTLSPEDRERIRTLEKQRKAAVQYLEELMRMGLPYMWGGDDPIGGFDCSGLIHEVLQSIGKEKHGFDSTAHELYLKYKLQKVDAGDAGCLVFWFKDGVAKHVEMMTSSWQTIGASGGGQSIKTPQDAMKHNAYIKRRPIGYRGENYKICDPFRGQVW